ncbi:hypothetical protein [Laceyella putida]|uniref:Uncharacterized protein n=1 Tax=Laceyella putida TaxID=110101 RepID=A0ABW2RQH3_9BACL
MNRRDDRFPYRKIKQRANQEKEIEEFLKLLQHSAVKKGSVHAEEERALSKELLTLRRPALFPQSPTKPSSNSLWHFMHAETFAKLRKYFTYLEEHFDEMHDRTQSLGIIKDLLHQLKNDLNPDLYKYERRICLIIHDAIHKAKAERLTPAHLTVLSRAFETLFQGQCDKHIFRQVDQLLRHHDLNWIIGDDAE